MDIIKDTFPSPQPQTEYSLQPVFAKIPFFGMIDLRFRSFLIPLPFQNHTTPLLPPLIFNHLIQPRRLITTLYPSLPSASPSPSFLSSPLPPPPLLLPPPPTASCQNFNYKLFECKLKTKGTFTFSRGRRQRESGGGGRKGQSQTMEKRKWRKGELSKLNNLHMHYAADLNYYE